MDLILRLLLSFVGHTKLNAVFQSLIGRDTELKLRSQSEHSGLGITPVLSRRFGADQRQTGRLEHVVKV